MAHTKNLNYYRSISGDHAIAYFYPRAKGDTIVSVLDNVKCTSASKPASGRPAATSRS